MTASEAASVTGVPLRQVHRIIDAGILGAAVKQRDNTRLLTTKGLVGLRLAHDTAAPGAAGRRGEFDPVAAPVDDPRRNGRRGRSACCQDGSFGSQPAGKARSMVSSTPDVLGGMPVFKGTRIPVHDIADMLANGDRPASIVKAYPKLDAERVRLASVYAQAYPARGRPRMKPRRSPKESETLAFDDLGRA
jgi:uncharacterized protein (DUF433 family)